MSVTALGIDFGTTNSVVAMVDHLGQVSTRRFKTTVGEVEAYRSALLFFREGRPPHSRVVHISGPDALDRALDIDGEHRFLQSLKTHLSSKALQELRLFGRKYSLEELIGIFIADLLPEEMRSLPVVAGRPVVFAGDRANEELAVDRLSTAYQHAGADQVEFAFEPLGAAYWYGRSLKRPETVLVADFGGGTSDFSLMHFDPGSGKLAASALAHAGVGIAGDTFDFRIIDHVVAPRLGKGALYRSFDKLLPIPAHYHAAFAQWHKLSLLKSPETMRELQRLIKQAEQPQLLEDLLEIIEYDLGYELYLSVSRLKAELSHVDRAQFRFSSGHVRIEAEVSRAEFEGWIKEDLQAMSAAIDRALESAHMTARQVDAVFMTGGTSFVPAVRNLFATRFGTGKLHFGDAFNSVASGLALIARDRATT